MISDANEGLIQTHDFNSAWWGKPVAILEDPAFFLLPAERQRQRLEPFDWAEFRCSLSGALPLQAMRDAGFIQADTQVRLRVRLPSEEVAGAEFLSTLNAADPAWSLDCADWRNFSHERFRNLPDMGSGRLQMRYTKWAEQLVTESPAYCFQVARGAGPQGWFFGRRMGSDSVELALAVLRTGTTVSGLDVYRTALRYYAKMGYRIGFSSFSISNSAVHNIFAQLGARFTAPTGVWLWVKAWSAG